ncbi:DNA-3-methyladenine glycosylase [Pseudokineococcus sp. 1T1Z-3]|uniref:DNA-3-methyladenine glycosylase n=1 Tax=Pseudokineococcus sp. 1T1Z-3 TaxID=3132745 RepID=UPI00309691B9
MPPDGDAPLPAAFYDRPVLEVARDLLGCRLVVGQRAGRVVVRLTEVEAYGGAEDPGSHAARGRTPRTAVMFGPPGHLYVYFSYGMHWCANVVTGPEGSASAVLLRAGDVTHGHDLARARRPAARTDRDLARGPARLAAACGVDGGLDAAPLTAPTGAHLLAPVEPSQRRPEDVVAGPRVGVSGPGGDGAAFPWRLSLAGERSVSAYRPGGRPRRSRPASRPTATG